MKKRKELSSTRNIWHLIWRSLTSTKGTKRLTTRPCPLPLMKSSKPISLWWAWTRDCKRYLWSWGRTRLLKASSFHSMSWIFSTLNSTVGKLKNEHQASKLRESKRTPNFVVMTKAENNSSRFSHFYILSVVNSFSPHNTCIKVNYNESKWEVNEIHE